MSNGKRSASTTFKREEIEAVTELFDILFRGGDPSVIVRRRPMTNVYRKFTAMKGRID